MLHQFYFTHCTKETSLIDQAEYGIRAASLTKDQISTGLVKIMDGLAIYRLPREMRKPAKDNPDIGAGYYPVRLARLITDAGGTAVVHSVYYPEDTIERQGSFFSHVLLPDKEEDCLSAAEVLATWGVAGEWGATDAWAWEDRPADDPDASSLLHAWQANSDAAASTFNLKIVRQFLLGEEVPFDRRRPALRCTPRRLLGPEHETERRCLLRAILMGRLQGMRVRMWAEPGLAALLVYAVTQLLPPAAARDLTFSTYEVFPKAFRNRAADVVNTFWEPGSVKLLDEYQGHPNDLVLDTYAVEGSKNLRSQDPWVLSYVENMLDLLEDEEKHDQLPRLWKRWEQAAEASREVWNASTVLKMWRMEQGLHHLPEKQLPDTQLEAYLDHPRWREYLFDSEAGREQTVDFVIRHAANPPDWWSECHQFDALREPTPSFQALFRDALVELLTVTFEDEEKEQRRYQIAEACFEKLLPLLCEEESASLSLVGGVVTKLEEKFREQGVTAGLCWTSRRLIIEYMHRHQQIAEGREGRRVDWLAVVDEAELCCLCEAELSTSWKAESVLLYLDRDEPDFDVATRLLMGNAELRDDMLRLMGDRPAEAAGQPDLLAHLFDTCEDFARKQEFALQIIGSPALSQDERFTSATEHMLASLVREGGKKDMACVEFVKREAVLARLQSLGTENAVLNGFWTSCLNRLDARCLLPRHESRPLLKVIRDQDDRTKIPWTANPQGLRRKLGHLGRAHDLLEQPPRPGSADWHLLRYSFSCLNVSQPHAVELVKYLIQKVQAVRGLDDGSVRDIVETARSLAPHADTARIVTAGLLQAGDQAEDGDGKASISAVLRAVAAEEGEWSGALSHDLPAEAESDTVKPPGPDRSQTGDQEGSGRTVFARLRGHFARCWAVWTTAFVGVLAALSIVAVYQLIVIPRLTGGQPAAPSEAAGAVNKSEKPRESGAEPDSQAKGAAGTTAEGSAGDQPAASPKDDARAKPAGGGPGTPAKKPKRTGAAAAGKNR